MSEEQTLLEFPCEFPIKIMGLNDNDFIPYICDLVRPFYPELNDSHVHQRTSGGGKYISITLTIQATSKQQLDNIYCCVSADPRVKMAL